MRVFFDNTPITISRNNGVGNIGLHFFLALRKYGKVIKPHFLYRKNQGSQKDILRFLKKTDHIPVHAYHPYFSLRLSQKGKILHSFSPFMAPLPFPVRILHIHDMWTLRKNPYQLPDFQQHQAKTIEKMIKRSDFYTVMNETVKNEMVGILNIHPNKIHVLGYGTPGEFDQQIYSEKDDEDLRISEKELDEMKYVLSVGRVEYRKNFAHTISAVKNTKDLKLIIVGELGFTGENIVRDYFQALQKEGRLLWFEKVNQKTLNLLYQKAFAFLLPALEEGSGVPLREAMYAGIPVVTSNVSSSQEVVGEGGFLVHPNRPEETTQFLESLRQHPVREEWCDKARSRGISFQWKTVVEKLETFYQSLFPEDSRKS